MSPHLAFPLAAGVSFQTGSHSNLAVCHANINDIEFLDSRAMQV
jgi:hypothetical protein